MFPTNHLQLSLIHEQGQIPPLTAMGNPFGWRDPVNGKNYSVFDCPLLSALEAGDQVLVRFPNTDKALNGTVAIDRDRHMAVVTVEDFGAIALNRELCREIKENQFFAAIEESKKPTSQGIEVYSVRRGTYFYFRYWYRSLESLHRCHIPGGQSHNPIAMGNSQLVREWIKQGLKPTEIVAKIKQLSTSKACPH